MYIIHYQRLSAPSGQIFPDIRKLYLSEDVMKEYLRLAVISEELIRFESEANSL